MWLKTSIWTNDCKTSFLLGGDWLFFNKKNLSNSRKNSKLKVSAQKTSSHPKISLPQVHGVEKYLPVRYKTIWCYLGCTRNEQDCWCQQNMIITEYFHGRKLSSYSPYYERRQAAMLLCECSLLVFFIFSSLLPNSIFFQEKKLHAQHYTYLPEYL